MESLELSLIIPVLNERPNAIPLLEEVVPVLEKTGRSFEVLVVDDGSTDGTYDELLRWAGNRPRVRLIRFRRNFGKACALHSGIHNSRGSVLITMDGDGQDDPAMIPRLLETLGRGTDLVVGWKRKRKDPLRRRISSFVFNRVVNFCFGTRLHDYNSGLKAGIREAFLSIPMYGELHRFIPALVSSKGFGVAETEVHHRKRLHGRSRYGWTRHFRGAMDLLTVLTLTRFGRRPLHLIGGVGFLSFSAGGLAILYLCVEWLRGHRPIGNRPLLSLGILLVIVGVQFVVMGLLGELIANQTAPERSSYLVETTHNLETK